jgi:hypothetical protein
MKRSLHFAFPLLFAGACLAPFAGDFGLSAQSLTAGAQRGENPTFRVKVDMVVLGFTVTDNKGKYVNGLKPGDFKVYEDEIPQKLNTFAEGNRALRCW